MNRLGNYLRDTIAEMKHVSWPTQMQTLVYTGLLIAVSSFIAVFLGLSDYIFTHLLNLVVK